MVKTVEPKKPRTLKAEKPAPAAVVAAPTNQPDREAFHYHLGVIIQKNATLAAHRKELKQIRRAAQDAGLNLADMDRIIRMREEEPETVKDSIARLATYAAWAGLAPGTQGDLFTNAAPALDALAKAEDEGYTDGLEGVTASGDRYDAANEAGQARLRGHARGQKVLLDRFAANPMPTR